MPIYEYRCTSCGHELEALQKLSDPRLVTCPACNADALIKKVSAAGFQLKGSGWYATDFRNSGSGASAKKTADADASVDKSGDKPGDKAGDKAGSDAKPDAATTPAATKAEPAPAKPATPAPTSGASS
jgi:putative FmdB family regulatory protein